MDLASDFDEFIGSLNAHGVEFLIVGAYASAFHGAPRFTCDLDIFVRPTIDNAAKLLDAARAFVFRSKNFSPATCSIPAASWRWGSSPCRFTS